MMPTHTHAKLCAQVIDQLKLPATQSINNNSLSCVCPLKRYFILTRFIRGYFCVIQKKYMIMAIFLFSPKQLSDHGVISLTSAELRITFSAPLKMAERFLPYHFQFYFQPTSCSKHFCPKNSFIKFYPICHQKCRQTFLMIASQNFYVWNQFLTFYYLYFLH